MRIRNICGKLTPMLPNGDGLGLLAREGKTLCGEGVPIRLAITKTTDDAWDCEIDAAYHEDERTRHLPSLFEFRRRGPEVARSFTAVMVVPTGTDCVIGGHAGDATPAAKVLGAVCDRILVHPNIVNASDMNDQPANAAYVEGSVLTRLLMGTIALKPVRANRILVITERRDDFPWVVDQVVNSCNAARSVYGANCVKVLVLGRAPELLMDRSESGRASGRVEFLSSLLCAIDPEVGTFDAIALATKLSSTDSASELFRSYFLGDGPNPWGGVEASLTHVVSSLFDVPSAHAPTLEERALRIVELGQVDPRKAAEAISTSYFMCVLRGLQNAPAIIPALASQRYSDVIEAEDISCVVVPRGCLGMPTLAAILQHIPVIEVCDNTSLMKCDLKPLVRSNGYWPVRNYFEAAGIIAALRAGVDPTTVGRPLSPLCVVER